jgi:exodeoxyribonuclease VII small subunit
MIASSQAPRQSGPEIGCRSNCATVASLPRREGKHVPDEDAKAALTFEEALAGLESVVARLESGDVGLEEAVALFEEGQRHLAVCRERLAAAQGRIDELTASELPKSANRVDEPF